MDVSKYQKEYKEIKSIFCPYLKQEVFFTSKGFSHLIWKKGSSKRDETEIVLRMKSLKYLKEIIGCSGTLQEYEEIEGKIYFAFIAIVDKKKFKVVVSRVKDGRHVFVSIIPRWVTGKRDKNNYKILKLKNPSNDG